MKLFYIPLLMTMALLVGCEQGPAEKLGENIDDAGDSIQDTADNLANDIEDGCEDVTNGDC